MVGHCPLTLPESGKLCALCLCRRVAGKQHSVFRSAEASIVVSAQQAVPSEPGFLLVAHSQDRYAVIRDVIARYVTAIAEVDDPVAEHFVHTLNGPTDLRMPGKDFDAVTDGLYRPTRGGNVLYREKAVKPLDTS